MNPIANSQSYRRMICWVAFSISTVGMVVADERPNIVLIMADDLGYNDVGFNGSTEILTPHLDKLAAGGVILKSMYVQPVCSPTRAAFLSGRYPMRYGLQTGIISPKDEFGLNLKELTIAQEMKSLGYQTAICGKWHVGWVTKDYWPMSRGFDLHYGMIKAGMMDNTLMVFSSDNGGVAAGVRSDNTPLRAGKGTVYEGGVRACAFARWPQHVSPGTIDAAMHVTDWDPTFIEAAGGEPQKQNLDGVSLFSFLTGGTTKKPRDHVLLNSNPTQSAVRRGNWKLIVHHQKDGRDRSELFDLSNDISETTNLSASHPDKVQTLRKLLETYITQAAPPLKGKR